MNKEAKVNYPKIRTHMMEEKLKVIQPPHRKTMYDVVLENFAVARRVTFLHRIIYVGEHTFSRNDDMIKQCFSSSISIVNDSPCLERLTGFLLYYNRYFVHLVEGDEDSLNAHLGLLLTNEKFTSHLKTMKLLIHVSHINQRMIINWNCLSGVPPKLLGEIDPDNCSLEDSGRHIFNCVKKVYTTVTMFVEDNYSSDTRLTVKSTNYMNQRESSMRDSVRDSLQREGDRDSLQRDSLQDSMHEGDSLDCHSYGETSSTRLNSRMSNMSLRASAAGGNPYRSFLPEVELLNFIIRSSFTQHLREYYSSYGVVPQRDIYKDKVWPVPSDFIPYDIFTSVYQNVTELPKAKPKSNLPEKKTEDEENNVEEVKKSERAEE